MASCVRELEESYGVGGGRGVGRNRHRGRGGSCKLGTPAGGKRRGEACPHVRSTVIQAIHVEYSQEWGRIGSLHGELRSGVRGEFRRWRRPGCWPKPLQRERWGGDTRQEKRKIVGGGPQTCFRGGELEKMLPKQPRAGTRCTVQPRVRLGRRVKCTP